MSDAIVYSFDEFINGEGIKKFVPDSILEQQKQAIDNIINNEEK
jgi:hypothetical protein